MGWIWLGLIGWDLLSHCIRAPPHGEPEVVVSGVGGGGGGKKQVPGILELGIFV